MCRAALVTSKQRELIAGAWTEIVQHQRVRVTGYDAYSLPDLRLRRSKPATTHQRDETVVLMITAVVIVIYLLFLRPNDVTNRQTNIQTHRQTNAGQNITSLAEVMIRIRDLTIIAHFNVGVHLSLIHI